MCLANAKQTTKQMRKRDHRPDQPLAQLDQMLHQRRLGRFQRGFVFGGGLDHGACAFAGEASSCGSGGADRRCGLGHHHLRRSGIFVELLIGGQDTVLDMLLEVGQWALVA